jgi:hypothetical protein
MKNKSETQNFMTNYKAVAENTDENERLLTQPFEKRAQWRDKHPPDLCIEVFDVRGNTGTIYSKQMKCEFPSGDLAKDIGQLAKEWLDLREAYL